MRVKEDWDYLFESEPWEFKLWMIEKLSEMEENLFFFKNSSGDSNFGEKVEKKLTALRNLKIEVLDQVTWKYFIWVSKLLFV